MSEALSEAAYMHIGQIFSKQTNSELSGQENAFLKNQGLGKITENLTDPYLQAEGKTDCFDVKVAVLTLV